MVTLKRTYALPLDVVTPFEEEVAAGRRSGTIASLMREFVDERRRERLRAQLVAGCREMAREYLAISNEHQPLEEEADHAIHNDAETRSDRPGPPRPSSRE